MNSLLAASALSFAPVALMAQVVWPIDSVSVATAIAAQVLSGDQWRGVIDTSDNRWNALVRQQLARQAPERLRYVSDSAAHYAPHFSIVEVERTLEGATAEIETKTCGPSGSSMFVRRWWSYRETKGGWEATTAAEGGRPRDLIATGHGVCPVWKR